MMRERFQKAAARAAVSDVIHSAGRAIIFISGGMLVLGMLYEPAFFLIMTDR